MAARRQQMRLLSCALLLICLTPLLQAAAQDAEAVQQEQIIDAQPVVDGSYTVDTGVEADAASTVARDAVLPKTTLPPSAEASKFHDL